MADYDPSGVIVASSRIKGLLNRKSNPHVEIDWQLRNGRIAYKKSKLTFKDLSFSGHLSNGAENRYKTSSVAISDFKARLGSSGYSGAAILKEFTNPLIDLSLKGRVFPGELKEFFNLKDISSAEGSVDMDLRLVNCKWPGKTFSLNDFIGLKPEGRLTFNSFTIGFQNNKTLFSKVNGELITLSSIKAKNIQLNYKGQNIKINGDFRNLPEWLSGKAVRMTAKADVTFDRLIPETFFRDTPVSRKISSEPESC